MLKNKVSFHEHSLERGREMSLKEVDKWIELEERILVLWREKEESGVLPLMDVVQPTKNKV